jgi:4'-phosphopantetheinyl transferase
VANATLYYLSTASMDAVAGSAWLAAARAHLDPAERARFDRYCFDEKKLEFLLARVLLRGALAAHGFPAARLDAPDGAKPRLAGDPPGAPRFSLSHTRGAIALALAPVEVGLDVERVREVSDGLEARVLHDEERARLREPADFFRFWTAKEAYMKLRGAGLAIAPKRLKVELDARVVRDLETGAEVRFASEMRGEVAIAWMIDGAEGA